ncbi:hypothetical protein Tco_1232276 [Tanacetum coccineum]
MQSQESKIDTGKIVKADLVVTESSGTESEVQNDSSGSGNDTDINDADIIPIYNEEPMTELQEKVFAIVALKNELRKLKGNSMDTKFAKPSVLGKPILQKKCMADEPPAIPLYEIQVDDKLHFVEEPVKIMDREVKHLKQSRIPIVKVHWNYRKGPEFTWERKDQMQKKYPHLFPNFAPMTDTTSWALGTKLF